MLRLPIAWLRLRANAKAENNSKEIGNNCAEAERDSQEVMVY